MPPCPDSPTSRWSTTSNWTDCFGTFTYASGDKYVGEFKDDKFNGQGTETYANGNVKEGIWLTLVSKTAIIVSSLSNKS